MKKLDSLHELSKADEGSFIRFGGRGILDGLKGEAVKMECFKIIEVVTEIPRIVQFALYVQGYKRRYSSKVTGIWAQQQAEVYTPAEFKALPMKWMNTK